MSEEREKGKSQSARPVTEAKKSPEKVIYLGPTIVENGGAFILKYSSIYSNGLPKDIASRVESDPDLAKLFVPVAKAPEIMNKLSNKDSDLSLLCDNVKKSSITRRKKAR